MTRIDYYFSVLSPFTYLAGNRLEELAEKHGVKVNYKPMDILDLFGRTGGVPPKDRHPSRKSYRLQELRRISQINNMSINLIPAHWPTNPVPASLAIIYANLAGKPGAARLTQEILASVWAREKNIAEIEVVNACLAAAGLDIDASGLGADENLSAAFAQNTDDAETSNVFGSPTYVVDDQVFWGQDRLSHLDAWLGDKIE